MWLTFKDGLGSGRKWIISRIFSKSTCAETKYIKRKTYATNMTKWIKTFLLNKLFFSVTNIWNQGFSLCIIVIEDLDDN